MELLAGVFNPIAYDGRVERESEALTGVADVTVVCPAGPELGRTPSFAVLPVGLPRVPFILTYVYFCYAFIRIALRKRPDLIHAHDYYMAAPGLLASRLVGARLLYDAHELIVPEPVGRASPLIRMFSWIERLVVPRADLVIAANVERAQRMAEYYAPIPTPLVVRNIPAAHDEQPGDEGSPVRAVEDEYRLIYQGVILLRRGLDRILDALAVLPDEFRLEVVGGGPDEERLAEEIASQGLSRRVLFRGRVPREDLHALMRGCDAGVLMYSYDSLNDRLCAPNKIFEYAQAGLPVLATDQEPIRNLVEGYGLGKLIARDDGADEIAAAIRELSARPPTDYASALATFLEENSWETEASRLSSAVAELRGVVP